MVHGHFGISETGFLVGHSVEFTEAAGSDYAHEHMMLNVRALALTAYQVITKPELLAAIKAEFEATREKI
jgi:hypothetical protein